MSQSAPTVRQEDLVFRSLAATEQPLPSRRLIALGLVSVAFHAVLLLLVGTIPEEWVKPVGPPISLARVSERPVVHLVAPRFALTQPQANIRKPSQEISLPQLLSRPEPAARPTPPPAAPKFTPPAATARASAPPPPPPPAALPGPPKIETNPAAIAGISPQGLPTAPPPPSEEKPKLALESLAPAKSSNTDANRGLARIQLPKSGIDEALRNAGRQTGAGLTVGESGEPGGGIDSGLRNPPGRNASNIELLSDPQGVDFKPYLIRVLASIRRNWYAVLPESAKMGRPGKVQIQFAISRDGRVPKLVIAGPSGTEAFDRAAVAGISASNPFPPLPPEFHGDQIRLQLSFLYNAR